MGASRSSKSNGASKWFNLGRGLGSWRRVSSCTHKDQRRCDCKIEARFYDAITGKQRHKVFLTKQDMERFLAANYQERLKRQGMPVVSPEGDMPTFEQYANQWLDGKEELRPNSRRQYMSALRTYAFPAFGDKPINKITKIDIERLKTEMYEKGVYEGTVKTLIKFVLGPIFRQAVEDGWRADNPADRQKTRKVPTADRYIPSVEEIHKIADCINPFFRVAIYLMAGAGLREGEMLGFSRDCILEDSLWIYRQWTHSGSWGPLKYFEEGEGRHVPLSNLLREELERHIETYNIPPNGVLFPSDVIPDLPVNNSSFDRELKKAVIRAGLEDKAITAHNFRHAFATYMVQKVDVATVSKMLGHKSVQTTYKTYIKSIPPAWARAAAVAQDYLTYGTSAQATKDRESRIQDLLAELTALGVQVTVNEAV